MTPHVSLPFTCSHQDINAALAVALCWAFEAQETSAAAMGRVPQLAKGDLPDSYIRGLQSAQWPGRCQVGGSFSSHMLLQLSGVPPLSCSLLGRGLEGSDVTDSSRLKCMLWESNGSDTEREREIYFKSHFSLWEHSSHFRLIGRGVPSVLVVS